MTTRQAPLASHRTAARALLALLLALVTTLAAQAPAAAQAGTGFAGTYQLNTESGPITLTLQQAGSQVSGTLQLGGFTYPLEGQVDDVGMFGVVNTGDGELYFEAEVSGADLYMIMAQVDPNTGSPDPATAGEYLFTRVAGSGSEAAPPAAKATRPQTGTQAGTQPGTPPSSGQPAQPGTPSTAQPAGTQPAQVGTRYESGSRVGSDAAGVSFVVPGGYYAGYHPDLNLFVVLSDTAPGLVAVSALSSIDKEEAIAELSASFESSDGMLVPQGQPSVTGHEVRARFSLVGSGGARYLYLMGVGGPAGNVLILAGLGAPQEQAAVDALVEGMARSAAITAPTRASATAAAGQLAGVQLRRSSSRSQAGLSDGYVDHAAIELDLCSNGKYAYLSSSQVSVSVYGQDGGSVGGTSSSAEEDQGQWSVESGLLGPVIVLRSQWGGGASYLELLQAGDALYVDGLPVQTSRSPRCA